MTLPTQSVGYHRDARHGMSASPGVHPALPRNPFKMMDYIHCMMRTTGWIPIIAAQQYCACVYLEGGDPRQCEMGTGSASFEVFPWYW